ncbi:unnamed protein product [Effrenium voratum]|nr:unnamed protein product [Effrenium voratum]
MRVHPARKLMSTKLFLARSVSRQEHERLEERLARAEKAVMMQAGQIQELQAQVDALLLAPARAAPVVPSATFRERSRTPAPAYSLAMPIPAATPAVQPVASVFARTRPAPARRTGFDVVLTPEQFAEQNGLDEKCLEALLGQAPEVQDLVISQGPAEGRNPSAMVMGRIAKAMRESGSDMQQQVETFITENLLDEKCAEAGESFPAEL